MRFPLFEQNSKNNNRPPSYSSILVLGDLTELKSSNETSLKQSLKLASINENKLNEFHHCITRDDSTYNLFIFKYADKLMHRHLFATADLIMLIPNDVKDFNDCVKLVKDFAKDEQPIYYVLPMNNNSHSLIADKAKYLQYQQITLEQLINLPSTTLLDEKEINNTSALPTTPSMVF